VEALQCIKCAIQHNLLFHEPPPSSISEANETNDEEMEDVGASRNPGDVEESDVKEFSWDELLIEDENKEMMYKSE
jgi:hypothetical protein